MRATPPRTRGDGAFPLPGGKGRWPDRPAKDVDSLVTTLPSP